MASLVVLYHTPADPAAFVPALRKYEVSRGPVNTPAGPSPFQLIATLYFDDVPAVQRALASPEFKAAARRRAELRDGRRRHSVLRQREV